MTLAPGRPITDLPLTATPPAQPSLAAQLLKPEVLGNLIDESKLPQGIDPYDGLLVYFNVPGRRLYLDLQFCRSGPGRVHPIVTRTNGLLTAEYRKDLGGTPTVGPLTNTDQERVRELVALWWLKPNAEIKLGTPDNPHHWHAVTPEEALTPLDCLAQLRAAHPLLVPNSIEQTLRKATRHL